MTSLIMKKDTRQKIQIVKGKEEEKITGCSRRKNEKVYKSNFKLAYNDKETKDAITDNAKPCIRLVKDSFYESMVKDPLKKGMLFIGNNSFTMRPDPASSASFRYLSFL